MNGPSSEDRGRDAEHGQEVPGPEQERRDPQGLGILFLAAALGLTLLLTIVGLLAFAAMSRSPPAVCDPAAATTAS